MLLTKDIFEIDCENCGNTRILKDGSPQMSPLKSPPKQLLSPNKFDECKRGTLEKSNSLSESNSSKQLRTTKSLSPRAPIKSQMAVDESVIVSVVVSTVEEEPKKVTKKDSKKDKEISNGLKVDIDQERAKNRSTGCLVYVPSDPWTKMDSTDVPLPKQTSQKKGEKRMNKLMDVKSQSKPDLVDSNVNDPWVRLDATAPRKNAKSATYRQSKSLHLDSKSSTARPRLQRSKSPLPPDKSSPKDPLSSLSPTLGYHMPEKDSSTRQKKKNQQFLNVSNPNLLQQPRHSFSTSPTSPSGKSNSKKDDELTLNIRRLSEQIKYSSTYASYGNFQSTANVNVGGTNSKQSESAMEKSASLLSDSLLETTC